MIPRLGVAAVVALLGCSAEPSPPAPGAASASTATGTSKPEIVESKQALNVDTSCNSRGADYPTRLRNMQTEIRNLVWNAAYSYMDDPWSGWAWYAFSQPNYGQYQTVVDSLWTIALALDGDPGWGGPITYDCVPQNSDWCRGSGTAAAERLGQEWRIHLCESWDSLKFHPAGAEHGRLLQRAALVHEFFHFLGYQDSFFYYCDCAVRLAWSDPMAGARVPDTYATFIAGINGVPSFCELAPAHYQSCAWLFE